MIFGDAAIRQTGEDAQVHHIKSEDNGVDLKATVREMSCGQQFFALVTEAGELQTWGLAEGGRLGHGSDYDLFFPVPSPTAVTALQRDTVRTVSCGASHCVTAMATGEVYSWGDNRSGQLGLGMQSYTGSLQFTQFTPQRVTGDLAPLKVTAVACGACSQLW